MNTHLIKNFLEDYFKKNQFLEITPTTTSKYSLETFDMENKRKLFK